MMALMLRYVSPCRSRVLAEHSLQGVIFDMDGTLTVPALDFAKMKRLLGLQPEQDILASVNSWPDEQRARAHEIIEQVELEGREKLALQPGLVELLEHLERARVRAAIVTRNNRAAVEHFLAALPAERRGYFVPVLDRTFQPVKPAPDAALHICRAWDVAPEQVPFVGDSRDDLLCGRSASTATCLLLCEQPNNHKLKPLADLHANSLTELLSWLRAERPIEIVVREHQQHDEHERQR